MAGLVPIQVQTRDYYEVMNDFMMRSSHKEQVVHGGITEPWTRLHRPWSIDYVSKTLVEYSCSVVMQYNHDL